MINCRYKLARGSQVREEDFGLLFYKMNGPRLYFISSGGLISPDFFSGNITLEDWLDTHSHQKDIDEVKIAELMEVLDQLCEKGVVVEC